MQGLFSQWMTKLFGDSWKTGLAGALTFGISIVTLGNTIFPNLVAHQSQLVALITGIGGLATGTGLYLAKDHNVDVLDKSPAKAEVPMEVAKEVTSFPKVGG